MTDQWEPGEVPEVLINDVRYVPATDAVPRVKDVLQALALQFHTPESLQECGTSDLRILVGHISDSDYDEGETFDGFAARLRETLEGEKVTHAAT